MLLILKILLYKIVVNKSHLTKTPTYESDRYCAILMSMSLNELGN